MATKSEIEKLKKVINDERTTPEEKARFESILKKIEEKNSPADTLAEPVNEPSVKEQKEPIVPPAAIIPKKRGRGPNKIKKIKPPYRSKIPDCNELVTKFKASKKARIVRESKKKKDHRRADIILRDKTNKKLTGIVNDIIKLSKKKQLSAKVRKDVLEILKKGANHVKKA